MSKRNDDFFTNKKKWSETKDTLLGCYLKPYFEKIKYRKNPICYIDAFAGKGKFDDGKDGSPRIAMKIIDESFELFKTSSKPIVNCYFIDLNYADDLKTNLKEYLKYNLHVIDGTFEENIQSILETNYNSSVFLYIDPYGIKALNAQEFINYTNHFESIELLINFNSYGFFRNACRILNVKIKENTINQIIDNLEEYDNTPIDSKETLTKIIGTNQWVDTILRYKETQINAGEAETQIANLFCNRLKNGYKYVLNMPIKRRDEIGTKYRLIHCCNHPDGCILMANNMYKRSLEHREVRHNGQLSFFEFTVEDKVIDDSEIKEKLKIEINDSDIHLKDILANFFTKNGVLCDEKKLDSILKEFENNGDIIVKRNPVFTEKGKRSTFWSEKNGKDKRTILIKRGNSQ